MRHGAVSLTDGAQLTLLLYCAAHKKKAHVSEIKNIKRRQMTQRTLCMQIIRWSKIHYELFDDMKLELSLETSFFSMS